ncbi:Gp19/Gp15/Gp42 family protein [Nocardioides sp. BYT-33-1]|uniref:Gp19/Gp15/Gp42 family protein n=1 Tax=Nocardioides sp. BYT-33-1 TaxID=3416952 RepID=UPI003F5367A8
MPNPAAVADVIARWRPLSTQETTNAETFLADAWVMLKRRMALLDVDIEALIATDEALPEEQRTLKAAVVRVLATAVLRVMKNPDGKSREAIDDYSWSRDEAVSAGLLYFLDDELDGLVPGSGDGGRVFMVDPLADYAARFAS